MPIDEGTIHFINVNKSDGRILQEAYEKAKAKELDVALVTGKELLEKGVDEDQTLFVTDEFSGDVFDMLIAHKKRIFGPICVLQCIHNGGPLPDKPHPVHSFAMSKAIVTSTNMARPLKLKLEQRIEWMSGVFCKSFISEVTHLVAGDVGGAKYTAAARLDKPIVLPSWIEDAWQQAEYQLDATDTAFVGKHRCPTLKGCSICVSGLSGRQKEEIKRLVEENGGVYLPDLKMKDTTHLLIEKPTGQKYDFALRWSVHCVQPDWLYDSINARCWKKESPYLVKRDKGPHFNSNATLSITTVDATMNSTGLSIDVSRKAAQAAKQSAESYGSKDISNNSRQSSLQTSGLKSLRKSKDRSSKGGTCDYDVAIPSGEQFLDGCRLYLTGFNESQLEYLQKIINAGGGTRFNHINHSVSHIVVGDKPLQDVEKLLKSEFSPHVVTVQWLLESCRQVQCLPEQEYYCFDSNEVFEEDGKSYGENNNKEKRATEKLVDDKNDVVFKQYLDMVENANEPAIGATTEKDVDINDGKYANKEPEEMAENNIDITDETNERTEKNMKHDSTMESQQGNDEENVLYGLNFRLDGFTEEQVLQLQDDIENYGGNVLSNRSKTIADYLVVPLNYECEKKRAKNVVTYCWLERCVESGKILVPKSEFLFTPFSLPDEVFPLQDCVLSISQYADAEREHLMHLIEVLGGHFQEYFSRIAKTNILANTHLIVEKPEGSKYAASVNWNIPAVSSEWLYECARSGHKVPETPYMLSLEKSSTEKGESQAERAQQEIETDEKEELEDNINNVFNDFSVPQNVKVERGGDIEQDQGTGNKSEAPANQKSKPEKEMTSKRPPISLKVPAFFGKPQLPTFDLTDALEFLQSPCASSGSSSAQSRRSRGSSRNSFLMDDFIQEHLQAAVRNTGNLVETRKNQYNERPSIDKEKTIDKQVSIDKEGSSVSKEESTVDKDESSIDNERSTIGKEVSTIDKEGSTIDKDGSNIHNEGSTIDKEDHQEEEGLQADSNFLCGVVLAVSKKCSKQYTKICNMATSVGAQCRERLNGNCTHLIHEGRLTREQTRAKSKGVHVVSPYWLYDCIEQQSHLVESFYPSDYNPKLALSVVTTRRSTASSKDTGDDTKAAMEKTSNTLSQDKEDNLEEQAETTTDERTKDGEFPMDDLNPSELEAVMSQSSAQSDSLRNREEIKQIHDLMQSLRTTRRRSSRLNNSGNSAHSRTSSELNEPKNPRRQSSRLRSLRANEDNNEEGGEDGHAGEDEIIYDDPNSRHERQKIIAQLEDCSPTVHEEPEEQVNKSTSNEASSHLGSAVKKESLSPTSPLHSSTPTVPPPVALHITSKFNLPEPVSLLELVEEPEKVEARPEVEPKRRFILSTMSQQEKIDYSALIESLGGVVFDNQFFNPASRYTIAGQLNRNEKCLSSIAAGNWLLRKSYLEECRRVGHFVDEEAHEWGVPLPGESLTSLGVASRRWRTQLAEKSARFNKKFGAFQNWKVLLCVEQGKSGSFTRMLEAGGAKVLGTVPPFQNIVHVTHAFISPSAGLVANIDFERLQEAGILVLRTEYIVDYLTAGNNAPDTAKYFYRPVISNLQSTRKRKQRESGLPETPGKKKRAS